MQDPATLVSNPELTAAVTQLASMATHAMTGGMVAHGLETLKQIPWFASKWSRYSKAGKAFRAGFLAFLASLGVTGVFHYDPAHAGGVLTIVFSGVSAATIGQHVWGFAQSWFSQQFVYNVAIQPKTVVGAVPVAGAPANVPVPVVVQKGPVS